MSDSEEEDRGGALLDQEAEESSDDSNSSSDSDSDDDEEEEGDEEGTPTSWSYFNSSLSRECLVFIVCHTWSVLLVCIQVALPPRGDFVLIKAHPGHFV